MSFSALLNGSELDEKSLFGEAYKLWGANNQKFTANPAGFKEELTAASTLFGFLQGAGDALSAKQQRQVGNVLSTLQAVMVLTEPEPEPPPPEPEPKAEVKYAGMRSAPNANELPAPSMLFGSKLFGGKGGAPPAAGRPNRRPDIGRLFGACKGRGWLGWWCDEEEARRQGGRSRPHRLPRLRRRLRRPSPRSRRRHHRSRRAVTASQVIRPF